MEDANSAFEVAKSEKETKKTEYDEAKQEYDRLVAEQSKLQEEYNRTHGWKYKIKLQILQSNLDLQKVLLTAAEAAYDSAQKNYNNKKDGFDTAVEKKKQTTIALAEAATNEMVSAGNVVAASAELAFAKGKKLALDSALGYAKLVSDRAAKAQTKAEEAAKLVAELKNSADVKSEELAAALARLEELQEAFEVAQEIADQANADAERAKEAYVAALEKLAALIERERPVITTEGGDATTTLAATALAVETATVLPTASVVRTNRTNANVTQIEDESVALDAQPVMNIMEETESTESVEIEDDNTALAPTIEVEEAINWWWLLLVIAILGIAAGTGRYIYLRKEQEESAE